MMSKLLKFIFITILTLMVFFDAQAEVQPIDSEKTGFSLGGGLFYGFEAERAGIRLDALYSINEDIRIGVDLGFYFPENREFDKVKRFEFNVNGHYLFVNNEDFTLYGLAGINYFRFSAEFTGSNINPPGTDFFVMEPALTPIDGGVPNVSNQSGPIFSAPSMSGSDTGFNLGIGGEYNLNFGMLFGELRYSGIGGADQLVFGAGVRVPF
ncbi:MAG: outer membrane beta-barrel protein [Balneolaceae bacterium]|nr:outer membrane beta-barrel protein [Balneolaceae bacterium]